MDKQHWAVIAGVVLIAGALAAPGVLHHSREKKAMEYVQTVKLEPWAVGCHLIDVPQGAEVSYSQGYRGAGAEIEVFPCSLAQVEALVKERLEELRGVEHLKGGTLLERCVESRTLPHTWILYRWNERTFKGDVLDIDAYHWKASGQSPGYLFKFDTGCKPNEASMAQRQASLEGLYRRVRIRDNREIPKEPGFCMANSFFPDEAPDGQAAISYSVPGHPDIFVRFETATVSSTTAAGEKLLDRIRRVNADPMFSGLTSRELRARERPVGGLPGQEYLEMTRENGLWNMQFQWEFNGVGDSWDQPAMTLELTNSRAEGSREPLSMTPEEAMALWDVLVESIRLRPTTKAPAGESPLGTRLPSGARCPASGTWECAHGETLGGAKRQFRQGEEFPEAVLDVPRGRLGKLLGRPREAVVATTWTYVAPPDAS